MRGMRAAIFDDSLTEFAEEFYRNYSAEDFKY